MDYNDIDQIAECITDDLDTNGGLKPGLSPAMFTHGGASKTPYYDTEPETLDPPMSGVGIAPLVDRHGNRAKSVTLLEVAKGMRLMRSGPQPKSRPKPEPQPEPAPDKSKFGLSGRILEL